MSGDVFFLIHGYPVTFLDAIIVFSWVLLLWETFLNVRQIKLAKNTNTIPQDIKTLMDDEAFDKSRRYSIDKLVFDVVSSFYSIIVLTLFLRFNVLAWFWKKSVEHLLYVDGLALKNISWSLGVSADNEILFSLVFIVYISIFQFFDSFPWSYYRNFVIEERYGFNKQTFGFFVKDKIKGLLLGLGIGLPVVAVLLWIIQVGGQYFYLYAHGFTFAVSMVIMYIYPEFIAPIFDRYETFPESELRTKIEALAAEINFPLKKLLVVEGSKRSSHSNAYFYGFGSNKRIVLFDTLVKGFKMPNLLTPEAGSGSEDSKSHDDCENRGCGDDEEILAVLAHELGHWKMNHLTINLTIAQINMFLMFLVFGQLVNMDQLFIGFGFPPPTAPMLLRLIVVFQFIFMPYSTVLDFFMTMLSRKLEFQADAFAVGIKPGEKLKSALLVLTMDNLSFPVYDWLYSLCNLSHPPIIERMKAIDVADKRSN